MKPHQHTTVPNPGIKPTSISRDAFTLIELLVVIAIIALLAAVLLPTLSSAKAKGWRVQCLNNLKQLEIAFQMYSADNDGKLVPNPMGPVSPAGGPGTNAWVLGTMKSAIEATNQLVIRQGKLFPFASQVSVYRCPADQSQTNNALRVRSYSMNGWMGSRTMQNSFFQTGYRTFVRDNEIAVAGVASIWVLIDEHEASIDDGFFPVTMNDSQPFGSYPALRHNRGYSLSFADGHVEVYKLRDPGSQVLGTREALSQISSKNMDWVKLKEITTVR